MELTSRRVSQRCPVGASQNPACRRLAAFILFLAMSVAPAAGQDTASVVVHNDSMSIRFVDADLRAVVQALGRYLDKPLLVGSVQQDRVTVETPEPVPLSQVPVLLRGVAESYNLEFLEDSAFYRVTPATAARRSRRETEEGGAHTRGPPVELRVIRLAHARAADVAATVNMLFGGAGQFAAPSGFSTGTLSEELERDVGRAAQQPSAGEMPDEVGSAALSGPVTIVPDELTNSLLIRASALDHAIIEQAVQELDLRPLQVLIQVLIVEVRRDRAFSLGVDASAEDVDLGGATALSGFLTGGSGLGSLVLQIMGTGTTEIGATLRAAMSRGDARIISRPVVVASNNREARILVGSQRPFVQVSRSLPTDTPSRDQVVQYRDVGTKLTVLPTINTDGYVSLLIRQEVNSATSETQFDAPVIATREAETTVLVKDGQTVVMGGLRERVVELTKSGVPVLSSIPIVGGLFGLEHRHMAETELFLFITPMVLPDDETAAAAAQRALNEAERAGAKLDERGGRNR